MSIPINSMKLSAILPNYNDAHYLPKCIQSLINQTEPFSEIIIVDDGSTDTSLAIIDSFMKDYSHIRLIKHEQNVGVCQALNSGITNATGDYVILCAADDWYYPDIVALAKQIIQKFPSIGLVCGDAMVSRYSKPKFLRSLSFTQNNMVTSKEFKKFIRRFPVSFNGGGGMFLNRKAILEAGMLYPQLRWHCDWLLYYAVAFQHGLYYSNSIFVNINMRSRGYSEGKLIWKQQKKVLLDTITVLEQHYPSLWNDFKNSALLPHYAIRYIPLFLFYPTLRRFLSPQLFWRLLVNNALVVTIARYVPYRIVLQMRRLLRA